MQIVEASSLGVRAARYRFVREGSQCSVTLFPMVHIGEAEFYDRVYEEAFSNDVALVEGVGSPVAHHLTRSYRWMGGRLGLVIQPPYPPAPRARLVKADLARAEFEREWRRIPLWLRLAVWVAAPVVGLHLRWFGTRERIARRAELEDQISRDEILSWDPSIAVLQRGIVHARDERLLEVLSKELEFAGSKKRKLAVVFGAAHMRAVIAELNRRGFRAADATWQTVFYL